MSATQEVSIQNIVQSTRIDIAIMPAPFTSMVSDKGSNPISSIVGLPKDMPNSHRDGKVEKALDIIEDWVGI